MQQVVADCARKTDGERVFRDVTTAGSNRSAFLESDVRCEYPPKGLLDNGFEKASILEEGVCNNAARQNTANIESKGIIP